MRQYKFCPDKQKYNNAKPFPVYVVATALLKLLCCFSTQISHIWYPLSVFLRFSL